MTTSARNHAEEKARGQKRAPAKPSAQAALDAAKKLCKKGESERQHEAHRERLEAAYAAFAQQNASNPAQGETSLSAHVVVTSEDPE